MKKLLVILLGLLTVATTEGWAQRAGQRMSIFGGGARGTGRQYSKHFHNLDVGAGMGYHSVQFKLDGDGSKKGRVGFNVIANYRIAMFERVHFTAGLGLTSYSAMSEYDNLLEEVPNVDPENGETYTFKASFHDWNELQRSMDLEVPVGAYYMYPIRHSMWRFVAGGGIKMDIPVSKKYKTKNSKSDGKLVRSGEFESTNVEYYNLPQHGFFNSTEYEGKATMKAAGLSLFGDIGMMTSLGKTSNSLYFGVYFSHSLLNSLKGEGLNLYDPKDDSYCGIVSSNLVDKTHLMAVGARVAYCFGF